MFIETAGKHYEKLMEDDRFFRHRATVFQAGSFGDFLHSKGRFVPRMSVGELLAHGGLGLGAAVNNKQEITGEITVFGGKAYCTSKSGEVREMAPDEMVHFAQVSHMEAKEIPLFAKDREDLLRQIKMELGDEYKGAFTISLEGNFGWLKTRSVNSIGNRDATLMGLIDNQHEMQFGNPDGSGNVSFKLSGIHNAPGNVSDFETPTYPDKTGGGDPVHLHAVASDGKSGGGHVLDFKNFSGKVRFMPVEKWLAAEPCACCGVSTCNEATYRPAVAGKETTRRGFSWEAFNEARDKTQRVQSVLR